MKMRPYRYGELDKYPKVHITADVLWNPKVLDNIVPDEWYATTSSSMSLIDDSPFNEHGQPHDGDTGSDDGEIHPDYDEVESQRKPTKGVFVEVNLTKTEVVDKSREVNRVMVKNYLHSMVESKLVPQVFQHMVKGQVNE